MSHPGAMDPNEPAFPPGPRGPNAFASTDELRERTVGLETRVAALESIAGRVNAVLQDHARQLAALDLANGTGIAASIWVDPPAGGSIAQKVETLLGTIAAAQRDEAPARGHGVVMSMTTRMVTLPAYELLQCTQGYHVDCECAACDALQGRDVRPTIKPIRLA